jgi:hypothetical protein
MAGLGIDFTLTILFRRRFSRSLPNQNRHQANKKPGLNEGSAGINLSPACLASFLTWLQAGRLK